MKKHLFYLISVLFLFASCSFLPKNQSSGISVKLPGNGSREAGGGEVFYFTISCADVAGKYSEQIKNGKSGELITFENVTEGKYKISGKAYSDLSKTELKYTGETEAVVVGGENTNVTLQLNKFVEESTFQISFTPDSFPYQFGKNIVSQIQLDVINEGVISHPYLDEFINEYTDYSVYIADEKINSDGDGETSGYLAEKILGHVPFVIKDSENVVVVSKYIYISFAEFAVFYSNGGGSGEFESGTAVEFTSSELENTEFEVQIIYYDGDGERQNISIVGAYPLSIPKVYNLSGELISGFNINNEDYWEFKYAKSSSEYLTKGGTLPFSFTDDEITELNTVYSYTTPDFTITFNCPQLFSETIVSPEAKINIQF